MKTLIVDALVFITDALIGLIGYLDPDFLEDDDEPEKEQRVTKIWGVVDGPFHREDFPEEELKDVDIPDNAQAMVIAKVEDADGKIGTINLWVGSFNEAYEICKHFDTNIEPLIIKD